MEGKIENDGITKEQGSHYHAVSVLVGKMSECSLDGDETGTVRNYCLVTDLHNNFVGKYGKSSFTDEILGTIDTAAKHVDLESEVCK